MEGSPMAVFTKHSPESKVSRDLENAVAKRADLGARLQVAQTKAAEAKAQAEALAGDGADDAKLSTVESEMRAQQDRSQTLTCALVAIGRDIAALETEIAAIEDRKTRAATAVSIERIAETLIAAGKQFDAGATALTNAAREASNVVLDAHGLCSFSMSAGGEVPAAISMVVQILKGRAAATIAGQAPAHLPQPEAERQAPPRLALVETAPSTMVIVPLRHLKYANAQGVATCLGKFRKYTVPIVIGEQAINNGMAANELDARVKNQIGVWGSFAPDENSCTWIGDPPPQAAAVAKPANPPSRAYGSHVPQPAHPAFERATIGPAKAAYMEPMAPAEPMAMTGTRSLPPDDGNAA
jgi:hypothetical protein